MDSDRKQPKRNYLLRHTREVHNLTLQDVADRLYDRCVEEGRKSGISADTVGRWERGISIPEAHYRAKLCALFGQSDAELGLIEEPAHADSSLRQQDTAEMPPGETSEQDSEGDDMDRRRAVHLIGVTGASLLAGIPTLMNLEEWEERFARRAARLQTWALEGMEDGTRLRWQLYYTSRNSLTEEGLVRQIERLEQLADEGGMDESRVCSVLIQNYQLAGSLARDNFHYARAKQYFLDAQRLAQDIQSPDLSATSVARYALALLRQAGIAGIDEEYPARLARALELYQQAAEMASHAEAHVRAYILSGLAEALARTGQYDACFRTLDRAEQLFHSSPIVSPEDDIAHVRLTLQSLEDARGECYVLLGEPIRGLEYLQTAQKKLDPGISRNLCRVLMQQSEAYLAAGYLDECIRLALQGLQVARTLESTSNINWVREIHTKLLSSKWREEVIVGELEAALAG